MALSTGESVERSAQIIDPDCRTGIRTDCAAGPLGEIHQRPDPIERCIQPGDFRLLRNDQRLQAVAMVPVQKPGGLRGDKSRLCLGQRHREAVDLHRSIGDELPYVGIVECIRPRRQGAERARGSRMVRGAKQCGRRELCCFVSGQHCLLDCDGLGLAGQSVARMSRSTRCPSFPMARTRLMIAVSAGAMSSTDVSRPTLFRPRPTKKTAPSRGSRSTYTWKRAAPRRLGSVGCPPLVMRQD